ncbi:hypothetical protein ACS0TY_015362 [Phlomoides rotata]
MRIYVFILLLINLLPQALSESDILIGYQLTLAIPAENSEGFLGRAFLMEAHQTEPRFRVAISVEATGGRFACSLDVFLGDVRVWSSGHLSTFYTKDRCVVELIENGELRLKGENGRVGWKSGTSGQGVKRLRLLKTGNLVLIDDLNLIKWQSFNFPTDMMLWGQRLSSQTRLTSFPINSSLFYSMEIQDNKMELFLNLGKWKYSYWEHRLSINRNITFVQLTSDGLDIFNGNQRFDQIKSNGPDAIRFLTLENTTGNLRLYHYSLEKGKFEASYQALNFTCDLPLACKPYGICMPSGSCSCIRLIENGPNCCEGSFDGACGTSAAEMVELGGVASVLRSGSYKENVRKQECGRACLDDCNCVAAQYEEGFGECLLYRIARGVKKVERSGVTYMVKVGKGVNHGHGKNSVVKKWVLIVVGVVDGFIIFLVLGGFGFYIIWKRRKNLPVRSQES